MTDSSSTVFPDFFALAPTIAMRDPLADFLGAARDGILVYRFEDAVRLAGHSCPTVAAAFLMVRAGLKALHGDELPVRGEIRVEFAESRDAGVAGVMAAVAGLITGAADMGGFKGLGGRFVRRDRLFFDRELAGTLRLTRLDSAAAVDVSAQLGGVPGNPRMMDLLPLCLSGAATPDEARLFAGLWQDRVRRLLLEHADDPATIRVAAVSSGRP